MAWNDSFWWRRCLPYSPSWICVRPRPLRSMIRQHLRAQRLSQGQINGFPNYFLGFQRQVSTHFMFRFCTARVRATPFDFGADEYIGLELYTAWRGRGLPVETPAVR